MMREIKNIIFCSDKAKLTEKAFKHSMTLSVFGIILCIIALCSATWAWFSADISSSENKIQSAYCIVTVKVDNEELSADISSYAFENDKTYLIEITATGSAKSAYCIFDVGGRQYYTAEISTAAGQNAMKFNLYFDEPITVDISRCWGESNVPAEAMELVDAGVYKDFEWVEEFPKVSPENIPITKATDPGSNNNVAVLEKTMPKIVVVIPSSEDSE